MKTLFKAQTNCTFVFLHFIDTLQHMSCWICICFCVRLWWLRAFYQTQKAGSKTDGIPNCSCLVEQWPCFRIGQPVAPSAAFRRETSDRFECIRWMRASKRLDAERFVYPASLSRKACKRAMTFIFMPCAALIQLFLQPKPPPPNGTPTLDPSACRQLTRNKSVHSNCHINYVPLCLFTFPPWRSQWCADILYAVSTGW